ncbi:MAG: hypothetical protein R3B54_01590 [Bdellovibrionota bacterium]
MRSSEECRGLAGERDPNGLLKGGEATTEKKVESNEIGDEELLAELGALPPEGSLTLLNLSMSGLRAEIRAAEEVARHSVLGVLEIQAAFR